MELFLNADMNMMCTEFLTVQLMALSIIQTIKHHYQLMTLNKPSLKWKLHQKMTRRKISLLIHLVLFKHQVVTLISRIQPLRSLISHHQSRLQSKVKDALLKLVMQQEHHAAKLPSLRIRRTMPRKKTRRMMLKIRNQQVLPNNQDHHKKDGTPKWTP